MDNTKKKVVIVDAHPIFRLGLRELINQENYLVETVPVNEVPSDNGTGELLVTPLIKTPMPFIRYRMGDIGKVTPSDCGCGKSLQEIPDIQSTDSFFLASKNTSCKMDLSIVGKQIDNIFIEALVDVIPVCIMQVPDRPCVFENPQPIGHLCHFLLELGIGAGRNKQ